ncbi:hypothetical protein [Xanthomonas oryzae]|uniref:hypothetical protein n=1 Tax=Xanthomonas oryzae TaxID=347 RepID=UPI0011BE2845|nr:hypothetical protein [Xanthomonas oryzae]
MTRGSFRREETVDGLHVFFSFLCFWGFKERMEVGVDVYAQGIYLLVCWAAAAAARIAALAVVTAPVDNLDLGNHFDK